MSAARSFPFAAAGPVATQYYYCHQCDLTVTLPPSSSASAEISCPLCNGGFLEEIDQPPPPIPNPNPNPFNPTDLLSLLASLNPNPISNPNPNPNPNPNANPNPNPNPNAAFNPMLFLQDYLQQLLVGGANVQIVVENMPAFGGNLGDYFIGPGLEQLIQQLAENDPNRYGTPPASKSAVAQLPDVVIKEEMLECAVCKDAFSVGEDAKKMPCAHVFHKDCILPWLELHNSCPVCRHELPTDDPDYEQRRGNPPPANPRSRAGAESGGGVGMGIFAGDSGGAGGSGDGGAGVGDQQSPRVVERRFRISMPWPFRLGSQGEGSNSDGGSGGQGDGRSETRQEDLD